MERHTPKISKRHALTAAAALGALMLAGCASTGGNTVKVMPGVQKLMPDGNNHVTVKSTICVPAGYLSSRSRLIITPQLVAGDTIVEELDPIVVDAPIYTRKLDRMKKLEGYTDPYDGKAMTAKSGDTISVPVEHDLAMPEYIEGNARVIAFVTVDGCGECENADTLLIADVSNPVTLADKPEEGMKLSWIEPEFVIRPKIAEGKGEAKLQFKINKSDIRLDMGRNREEMAAMEAKLKPVVTDSLATLNSLDIFGMASADGAYAFNIRLARNRAVSARNWLVSRLGMTTRQQRVIKTGSRPEGWMPVLKAMIADGHPDTAAVRKIIEKYPGTNDDVQEKYIRQLKCWSDIREKYLQKDRKVEYVYTYTLRNFTTDSELLAMYGKRPDAFNEDELLRVAALMTDSAGKKNVYETIVKYFPQSQVAANNLAVFALRDGDTDKAKALLEVPGKYTPDMLNALAATYIYKGDYEKAVELLNDVELPQARYNLGLLKARMRKIEEAYTLLRPFNDINSAIMALSMNHNEEAYAIMEKLDNNTPRAEYVRALAAARLGRTEEALSHIKAAASDAVLRNRAMTEPDFDAIRKTTGFNDAVSQNNEQERL